MAEVVRVAKGDITDSAKWQALSDQHGGTLDDQVSDVTGVYVNGPKAERDRVVGDYDQRPVYRYRFADGSYVDARSSADEQGYEVVDYKPSDTFTTSRKAAESPTATTSTAGPTLEANSNSPTGYDMVTRTVDANGNGIRETNRRPATEAEVAGRDGQPGTTAANTGKDIEPDPNNPGHFRRVVRSLNPDGSGKAVIGYEAISDDEARKAGKLPEKPTVVSTNTTDKYIVKSDGSQVANPNYVAPKPTAPTLVDLPTGGKGQLVPDPSTPGGFKVVPVTGTQGPTLPAGIGQFQPDPSKPGYGLFERRQALLDLVAKGTITEAQVKEILAQDSAMTKSLADQATAVTNGANTAYDNLMTQRGQDITQADARLTSSNTQYSNALSFANQNAVGLARAGTTDIMGPLLRGMDLHAQRNGGLETPDTVALPKALSRYLTMDLPGMGKWAPVDDSAPTQAGAPPVADTPPAAPSPAMDPTAAPAGPQPPMGNDYSTTTDPSGGGVQAIDSMHPNQQLYQHLTSGDTDPEFAAAVAQHLGVTA